MRHLSTNIRQLSAHYKFSPKIKKDEAETSSFLIYPSNLRRITFRAVEIVETFGFDNVQSDIVEPLQKRDQLIFVNGLPFV